MPPSFSKEQKAEIVSSIRRYLAENLDRDLSEMQAGFLLEYFMSEIAPFAYNKGVEDARKYFRTADPLENPKRELVAWFAESRSGKVSY
jgi:uncharacterized protein (DUF2164 family)